VERESAAARGKTGEEIARSYLEGLGLVILRMNYRFHRAEVDIIAREGDVLVFCEVKLRRTDRYGSPEESVNFRKQEQIRRAAEGYLAEHRIRDRACRFDVVAIQQSAGGGEIRHIRNAF
jgi:putative endonuclease